MKTEDTKLKQVVIYEIVKLINTENTDQSKKEEKSFESLLNGKIFFISSTEITSK